LVLIVTVPWLGFGVFFLTIFTGGGIGIGGGGGA